MKLYTKEEVIESLKARRKELGVTAEVFAEQYGVSKQYMNSVLSGLVYPCEPFGFKKVTFLRRIRRNNLKTEGEEVLFEKIKKNGKQ